MKNMLFMVSVLLLLCISVVFGEEPLVITNDSLEKTYGKSDFNSDGDACTVINFSSYDEKKRGSALVNTNTIKGGGVDYSQSMVLPGAERKSSYLSITVTNTSNKAMQFAEKDIEVYTIKGNVISPSGSKKGFLQPGETAIFSGYLFPNGLSKVVGVKINCY